MPEHDPSPSGKPADTKPAPAGARPGAKPAPRPAVPPFLQVSLTAGQAKACGLVAVGLLAAVLALQLVGMLSAREPDPEVLDEVRTTARSAADAKKALDALDVRLKDEPANLPPDLAAAVKDAQKKLTEFSTQLKQFEKVLVETQKVAKEAKEAAEGATQKVVAAEKGMKEAATAAEKASAGAKEAATAAEKAAAGAKEAATAAGKAATGAKEASTAAEKATGAAAAATKTGEEVKVLVMGQPKLADFVKATDNATDNLTKHLESKFAKLDRHGEATRETNRLLLELIQLNRPDAGRADLAVVVSHGEKVNAVRLLPEVQRALDKNPARALFKGFRVAAAVEIDGLDLKPILTPPWPGSGQTQTFDPKLAESLPALNGRTSAPSKVDPAKLFPPAAGGDPTPRQCVFVTHPGYAPPPADHAGWKGARVDVILVAPADALAKLRDDADKWAAFCRGHGGMAILIPDSDLPAVGDALRRLAAPVVPAPPAAPAPTPEPKGKS